MKIAVSGGAGFIASQVADAYIDAGHEVVILDNLSTGNIDNINPKAKFIEIDINDEKIESIFESEKFDILNHHAAQIDVRISVKDPRLDANINVLGSINLYESARKNGVKKIIFASTGGAIYGEQDYFPADENHPIRPCSPYGITKLVNEKYLFYYKEIYGIDHVILRYGNVYGPRQNPHGEAGVVAIFAKKMLAGEQAIINGDGKNTRDYVFVKDLVRGNLIALNNNVSGTYNLSTGIEHDVNYIFRKLKEFSSVKIEEIHVEAKKGEQKRSVCSYDKFYLEHKWKPEVKFDDGLRATLEFFKRKI